MFMEAILSYFGTYTPAADGAMASFKFEYLTTLGFAAIVIFAGRAIVAHSALLRKYAIPRSCCVRNHLFHHRVCHQRRRNYRRLL